MLIVGEFDRFSRPGPPEGSLLHWITSLDEPGAGVVDPRRRGSWTASALAFNHE